MTHTCKYKLAIERRIELGKKFNEELLVSDVCIPLLKAILKEAED